MSPPDEVPSYEEERAQAPYVFRRKKWIFGSLIIFILLSMLAGACLGMAEIAWVSRETGFTLAFAGLGVIGICIYQIYHCPLCGAWLGDANDTPWYCPECRVSLHPSSYPGKSLTDEDVIRVFQRRRRLCGLSRGIGMTFILLFIARLSAHYLHIEGLPQYTETNPVMGTCFLTGLFLLFVMPMFLYKCPRCGEVVHKRSGLSKSGYVLVKNPSECRNCDAQLKA